MKASFHSIGRLAPVAMLLATGGLACIASAQGPDGATDPLDVIAARQALMLAIEDLMLPIDLYTVEQDGDAEAIAASAATIAAMLRATPHLFPTTTNRYDPDADAPETLALPAVWEDFAAFYAMAEASVQAATTLAETRDPAALGTHALALRATCDACHAIYLLPYERSGVTQEDRDFDFDSLFEN